VRGFAFWKSAREYCPKMAAVPTVNSLAVELSAPLRMVDGARHGGDEVTDPEAGPTSPERLLSGYPMRSTTNSTSPIRSL